MVETRLVALSFLLATKMHGSILPVTITAEAKFLRDETVELKSQFTIHSKKINVICGPSGRGKTTLLKSLIGLSDGFKIKEKVNLAQISYYVGQTDFIFHGSMVNLLFLDDSEHVTEDRLSDANDLINNLGLENLLKFSEERKYMIFYLVVKVERISIARALLSSRKLVLLDEPTAGLDLEMERRVFELFEKRVSDMTFLLVTHADLKK